MNGQTSEKGIRPGGRLFWPGVVLGAGLGGFVDGIVLHQLLQWHHLISEMVPPNSREALALNTLWDGIFHAATWVLTLLGVLLVLRAARRAGGRWRWRSVLGGMLAGFGLFNMFDGIVNHWLLQTHHIRSGPNELAYDLAFFALGILLAVTGWVIGRRAKSSAPALSNN